MPCNFFGFLFSLIKIAIVNTELDVYDVSIHIIYFLLYALNPLLMLYFSTSRLIKRVEITLSRVVVFLFTFNLSYKTMITWWSWPTYIILFFRVSPLNHY